MIQKINIIYFLKYCNFRPEYRNKSFKSMKNFYVINARMQNSTLKLRILKTDKKA